MLSDGGEESGPLETGRGRLRVTGLPAAIVEALIRVVGTVLARIAETLTDRAIQARRHPDRRAASQPPTDLPAGCGDAPLDLKRQRLFFSDALGVYFSGLLEAPDFYVDIPGQLSCPMAAGADPLAWLHQTLIAGGGHRIVVLAAAGGTGKTTLAARITRCLYQAGAIDMIVGDSAKRTIVDAATGRLRPVEAGFADPGSLYPQARRPGRPGRIPAGRPLAVAGGGP